MGQDYGTFTTCGSVTLGIITLLVVNLVGILLHELAACPGGKALWPGSTAGWVHDIFWHARLYVDTTDIWLENKRARLVVTMAGPCASLLLAGLAVIAIVLWPESQLNSLLFKFALIAYITTLLNFNPLLELDGYYILMDWLEIPMLRRRSLAFLRTEFPSRVRTALTAGGDIGTRFRAGCSREERIFTIFGLLSVLWTVYAIFMGAMFWQQRMAGAMHSLRTQGDDLGKIAAAIGALAISLPLMLGIGFFVLKLITGHWRWVGRQGYFENNWRLAALFLVANSPRSAGTRIATYTVPGTALSPGSTSGSGSFWMAQRRRPGRVSFSAVFWALTVSPGRYFWGKCCLLTESVSSNHRLSQQSQPYSAIVSAIALLGAGSDPHRTYRPQHFERC